MQCQFCAVQIVTCQESRDSALLAFDAVPSIHVHDANLIRFVMLAKATHRRELHARSEVSDVKVLPRHPSVYSLGKGSHWRGSDTIAYVGPKVWGYLHGSGASDLGAPGKTSESRDVRLASGWLMCGRLEFRSLRTKAHPAAY